jgi:hypothetical protein
VEEAISLINPGLTKHPCAIIMIAADLPTGKTRDVTIHARES